jgi:hypothetical protein
MSGLAGCNAWNRQNEPPTDTASDTPTEPAIPTESPTETPREKPPDVYPPAYMDLLPKPHLKGTEETPNANFVRVDWDWYLSNYDTEMRFGATSNEDWTLEANAGNLTKHPPPQYRLLHTPVGATIQNAALVTNIIPLFPDLGPELVRQCGFEMINESGHDESRARYAGVDSSIVDEILGYAAPGITYFIGVDIERLNEALTTNDKASPDAFPETIFYTGNDRMSGRRFFVSQARDRPILCVETGNEKDEAIRPAISRVTGVGSVESITKLGSLQWGLSRFATNSPVVIGQLNGGRRQFATTNYVQSPIRSLESYDTVLNGLNIRNGVSAKAQVVASDVNGEPPTIEELSNLYRPEDGKVTTSFHSSVSNLSANWNR